jgi:hypothetical protein
MASKADHLDSAGDREWEQNRHDSARHYWSEAQAERNRDAWARDRTLRKQAKEAKEASE